MKLKSVFMRFIGLYVLLKINVSVVCAVFDFEFNEVGVVATLIFSTIMSCDFFTKKNGAFFSKRDCLIIVSGFSLIHMLFVSAESYFAFTEIPIQWSPSFILTFIGENGLLQTAVICFCVWLSGKRFDKYMNRAVYKKEVQVYLTSVLSEAYAIKDIIESHGIPCDLRAEKNSPKSWCESFPVLIEVSLWINGLAKRDEVRRLIDEYKESLSKAPVSSGEPQAYVTPSENVSEGQFAS